MARVLPVESLRYSRAYTLCIEALHALCCGSGNIRERFRSVDPEFLVLRGEDFPEQGDVRGKYLELKKLLTRRKPTADEGDFAATVARSQLKTLERAAQLLWDVHREFSYFMNDNDS